MEKLTKIKVSELKIDEQLIKLRSLSSVVVSRYRQNYRTGVNFPPIVINKKTGLIVSGNHRATAMMEEFPEDHKINVIFRTYKNEREIVEDFTKENIAHGNELSGISRKLIMCKLLDLGASNEEIANLFSLPIKRIDQIGTGFRFIMGGKEGCETKHKKYDIDKSVLKPVKRGPEIPPEPIPKDQYEDHLKLDQAITFTDMANQIVRWCNNGWIEKNVENMNLAKLLIEHLEDYVEKTKAIG